MFDLNKAQKYMIENKIKGWLVYDFRGSNPVLNEVLGFKLRCTRRCFLWVPDKGDVEIIGSFIDFSELEKTQKKVKQYTTKEEMNELIKEVVRGKKIAMEYSEMAKLPIMSYVDAGTFEWIKGFDTEIVTSSDLFQVSATKWSKKGYDSHIEAAKQLEEIKDRAFEFIKKGITEFEVQEFIMREFEKREMETVGRAIVAVNENSANPHYMPTKENCKVIKKRDWVLIDLWGKMKGEDTIYADITWLGFVGEEIPERIARVFEVVRDARDKIVAKLKEEWGKKRIEGWMLDRVAIEHFNKEGFGEFVMGRSGHGIGTKVHSLSVNLDDFETKDTREVVFGIGFSVEPGVYITGEIGARCEINMFMDPEKGPEVTTSLQKELTKII